MPMIVPPPSMVQANYDLARRMAHDGCGAEDIVVRCHVAHDTAKQFVVEAELRRLAALPKAFGSGE